MNVFEHLRRARRLEPLNGAVRATLGHARLRAHVPGAFWKRWPVFGDFDVPVEGTPGFRFRSWGEPLGKKLFWRGAEGFEPGTADVFVRLARGTRHVVDVGAYTGYYTLLALTAEPGLKVHAFEPVAALRRCLGVNLALNDARERVEVVAGAVAEQSGPTAFFEMEDELMPSSSLVASFGQATRREVRVDAHSLDDYVAARRLRGVGLVKVDVEGAEDAALRGARQLLAEQRPAVICEVLETPSLSALAALLTEARYRALRIGPGGLTEVDKLVPDPMRRDRNFLFLPEERPAP